MPRHEGLTVKQAAFVKAYVRTGGNGSQADRDVGYKAVGAQAHENLKKPKIIEAIRKETEKAITAANLRPQDIVDGLLKEAGLNGKKPKDSMQGGRVRALELCGKTFALFADRQITNEVESIDGRELVLRLAVETPAAAIGMAIDLCLLDVQMVEALEPTNPDLAARMQKLIEAGAREPLDIAFDQIVDGS